MIVFTPRNLTNGVIIYAAFVFVFFIYISFPDMKFQLMCSKPNFAALLDYNRIIDIPFEFVLYPRVCKLREEKLIIVVHSTVRNFQNRKVIRETWGGKNSDIVVLFLMGISHDSRIMQTVKKEMNIHQDIVQGNFIDIYKNLTYKHVMGLKYIVYHCPNIKYLLKVDDDMFVNIVAVQSFLKLYSIKYPNPKNIICRLYRHNPVNREGKWGVPVSDYPYNMFPRHCSGSLIIYPNYVVFALYQEAQRNQYFWIDDVHVSGTLARHACIDFDDSNQLRLNETEVFQIVRQGMKLEKEFLTGCNNLLDFEISRLWNYVLKYPPRINADILNHLD